MNKSIQRDEDRQLHVPNVFKDKSEGKYMLIKKEEFESLIECNKSVEETVAIVEKITIGVGLIVIGMIIGMILLWGEKLGDVYSWVDDNYKYEDLRSTARSVTKGTILKRFIGSVWHQINEKRGYESQFYIANVTDRGDYEEYDGVPVYITEMDDDFRKDFNKNRRFKKINKT